MDVESDLIHWTGQELGAQYTDVWKHRRRYVVLLGVCWPLDLQPMQVSSNAIVVDWKSCWTAAKQTSFSLHCPWKCIPHSWFIIIFKYRCSRFVFYCISNSFAHSVTKAVFSTASISSAKKNSFPSPTRKNWRKLPACLRAILSVLLNYWLSCHDETDCFTDTDMCLSVKSACSITSRYFSETPFNEILCRQKKAFFESNFKD